MVGDRTPTIEETCKFLLTLHQRQEEYDEMIGELLNFYG